MNTFFYSSPYDGGQSDAVRKALRSSGIEYSEINPFALDLHNQSLIQHKLSAVPCVIMECAGKERHRVTCRVRHGRKTQSEIETLLQTKEVKDLQIEADQEQAIRLEFERVYSEKLGFTDLAAKKQSEIDEIMARLTKNK